MRRIEIQNPLTLFGVAIGRRFLPWLVVATFANIMKFFYRSNSSNSRKAPGPDSVFQRPFRATRAVKAVGV
jgi:hypothetical protein